MKKKIIVVDDDREILKFIKFVLKRENYSVATFTKGIPGLEEIRKTMPDVVILDLTLDDLDGLDLCGIIKREENLRKIPVIMETGRKNDESAGFETGADYYLNKPYTSQELLNRVKAAIRRAEYYEENKQVETIEAGPVKADILSRKAYVDGRLIRISSKLFDLLCLFIENKGKTLKKDFILDSVWGYSVEVTTRTLDTYVWRLRKSLGRKASKMIKTVQGVGYRFEKV